MRKRGQSRGVSLHRPLGGVSGGSRRRGSKFASVRVSVFGPARQSLSLPAATVSSRPEGTTDPRSHQGLLSFDTTLWRRAFGLALRAIRLRQGISHRDLSISADIEVTYISLLERARRSCSLAFLLRICSTLGTSPPALIDECFEEYSRMCGVPIADNSCSETQIPTAPPLTTWESAIDINLQELKKALGVAVKDLRVSVGLTPVEASLKGGFHAAYWSALERGEYNPQLLSLCRVAFAVAPAGSIREVMVGLVAETVAKYQMAIGRPLLPKPVGDVVWLESATEPPVAGTLRFNRKWLHKLENPLRGLRVLELTLNGNTYPQCAQELRISRGYCHQLALCAIATLLQPQYLQGYRIPVHDWTLQRKRLPYRKGWLRLIEHVRQILAAGTAGTAMPEGTQGSGAPAIDTQSATYPSDARGDQKLRCSSEVDGGVASERTLRDEIHSFRPSDRLPPDQAHGRVGRSDESVLAPMALL